MKGFFRFGIPIIRFAIEGRKIETLLDTDFSLAGMDLFHDCKIVVERNKDTVEVTKSK